MRTAVLLWALAAAGLAQDCPSVQVSRSAAISRFQELSQAASQAFQHAAYEDAARNFRQALCLVPDSAEVYFGLGLAEAAAGHFDRAAKALEQADRLSPHNFPILLSRAQVEASAGNFELSRQALRRAERLTDAGSNTNRSPVAQLHGQLGAALLQKRELDLALAELLRAAQAGLRDPAVLLMLATLENNLGAYADAIRDSESIDGNSDATTAQRATAAAIAGLAYKNQKKNEDAIRLLKHAIELAPGETAYLALAQIYETSEQVAEAARLLEQGAAMLPGSEKIAVELGKNLVNAGENQRAVHFLSGIMQKNSADAEAWRWLAQAQSSLGEFKKATETLEQLERRQPSYPMIDLMVAQSLLKWEQPDYQRALRLLDRAALASPIDADIPYMRGKIYFAMGRYADAVKPLQRAIELSPSIPAPYYQLGQTLQKLGREAEAKEQFDKMRYLKSDAP